MSATVIIMPVAHRPNFADPSWREQYQREVQALYEAPFRTRPLLVVNNTKPADPPRWRLVRGMLIAIDSWSSLGPRKQLNNCHRPEANNVET